MLQQNTESLPVATAEARTVAPLLVSSVEAMASSRLFTVPADALLVDVAARLSSAQISVVVVCDAAGAAMGIITETLLVRRLGLGQADFFTTQAGDVLTRDFTTCTPQEVPLLSRYSPTWIPWTLCPSRSNFNRYHCFRWERCSTPTACCRCKFLKFATWT